MAKNLSFNRDISDLEMDETEEDDESHGAISETEKTVDHDSRF